MAENCVNLGCPEVLRLALQDPCSGAAIPGAGNGMVIRCSRNVTIEARVRDADTSEFVSDCGIVDEYVQDAYVQGYNVTFEVARISPEMEALLLGQTLLQIGADNVGTIEESASGCVAQTTRPSFIVEAFYKVRQCDASGNSNYLRRVIPGVRFAPVEFDKEGQIAFQRYAGTSSPTLASGLLNPVSGTAGPFQDFDADIEADISALTAGFLTPGLKYVDPIVSPTAGVTLVANTCYTATVPADV